MKGDCIRDTLWHVHVAWGSDRPLCVRSRSGEGIVQSPAFYSHFNSNLSLGKAGTVANQAGLELGYQ
jgi:hypothetical protein